MYCIDVLERQGVMLCLCEREMQLCDTERQRYRSTSGISTEYHNYRFEAASVCAGSQPQYGGGQIVTTGAPQQFSVSKWKPTPTPTHHLIADLLFISALGFSFLSVYVHIFLYSATNQRQTNNQHADNKGYLGLDRLNTQKEAYYFYILVIGGLVRDAFNFTV